MAIVLVLIQHVHERVLRRTQDTYHGISDSVFDMLLGAGGSGVLIFFTLSGYILGKIFVSKHDSGIPINLKGFYLRRLTRLEPPYVLVMTGIYLSLVVTGYRSNFARSFNQGAASLTDAWLASISYCYCPIFGVMPKLNPPAWSLEVEVQFYLLAPLLAWIFTRVPRGGVRLAALAASSLFLALAVSKVASRDAHLQYTLLNFAPYFLGGFAVLELHETRFAAIDGWKWDILSLASLIGLLLGKLWIPSAVYTPVSVAAAFLFVSGCLYGKRVRQFLGVPWVALIGGMCYSIYLIHLPLLELAANQTVKLGRGLPYPVFLAFQLLLLLPIVISVAWMFFILVERPCMDRNWPQKLSRWILRRSTCST